MTQTAQRREGWKGTYYGYHVPQSLQNQGMVAECKEVVVGGGSEERGSQAATAAALRSSAKLNPQRKLQIRLLKLEDMFKKI